MLNRIESKMRFVAKRSWNKHVHGLPQKWVSANLGEPCISEAIDGELTSELFPLRWFNLPTTWEKVDALF